MGPTSLIGVPGSGKSTLALELARAAARRNHWPLLVIDPAGVWNFEGMVHAPSLEVVVEMLWTTREDVAWTPPSPAEFDRAMEAVRAGGRVVVLIDEVRWYASAQYLSRPLSVLARTWRHAEVLLYMTTQRFGDLHQDLVACLSELRVFRCSAPRDLERLSREFGIDREKVAGLGRHESIPHVVGFES